MPRQFRQIRNHIVRWSVFVGVCCLLQPVSIVAGAITYQVTVDTSAIDGTSGFLDFGFAPGNDSQAAVVTITGFSPAAALAGGPQVRGGASGTLPGIVTLDNSTQFNDYFEGFTFGAALTFLLSFDGPALTAPDGTSTSESTFGFAMFDSTGSTPLLTSDPNGDTFTVSVNLDGTTTPTTFLSSPQGGVPVASLVPVPEPSTLVLLTLGLALTGARFRSARALHIRRATGSPASTTIRT